MSTGLQASKSSDELLYHYTSFEAFLSIVQNRTVWATERKYLNDATEFQYGLKLADEVFKSLDVTPSDAAKWFMENAERKLYTYVFSLSKQGDLLSQWRAYCPNGGVSIGFNRSALERLAKQSRFELVECIYSEELQRNRLKEVLEEETDESTFYKKFPRALASLKHPTFSEEEELRLVSESRIDEQQLYRPGWRATLTTPVQYTEISLSEPSTAELGEPSREERQYELEPFKEIIVGPSAHQELVQQAVGDFIADETRYGGSQGGHRGPVRVSSSQIPYRSK